MQLPIDARLAPFKEKYLDHETFLLRRWFQMGTDKVDGTLFLCDGTDDVFCGLTSEQANQLEILRNTFLDGVRDVLDKKVPNV